MIKNLYSKRPDKIEELGKKINYEELIFITESKNRKTNFIQKKKVLQNFLTESTKVK